MGGRLLEGPTMVGRTSTPAVIPHRCFRRYDTASLAAFTGRALMIFRAGFALNIVGSFVKGLMPFLAFVAGFFVTTNLANPGGKKDPAFLWSFLALSRRRSVPPSNAFPLQLLRVCCTNFL